MQRKANRKQPPAYQTYASDFIADRRYRLMSLAERGLLFSINNECWVNAAVPSETAALSKLLGFSVEDVTVALTERVVSFYDEASGQLSSPDLDKYKAHLDGIREKQSAGGKKGARAKQDKESKSVINMQGLPSGQPQGPRVEQRRTEKSKTEPLGRMDISDHWIDDYDRVSNGG